MSQADFHYDPFSPEVMRDPQSFYRRLRAEIPVYPLPQYDGYALSRFQDVYQAFLDREHFTESEGQVFSLATLKTRHNGVQPPRASTDPLTLFNFIDPPLHTKLRRVMAGPLHQTAIAREEGYIREVTGRTLDRLLAQGSFDANVDFASFISCSAVCHVIGLHDADVPLLVSLVNRINARDPGRPGPSEAALGAMGEFRAILLDAVARRRDGLTAEPCPLIDSLLACDTLGRPLTNEEVATQLSSILVGGTESLPKIIAGGLVEFWRDPDQRAYVAADPARVPAAIEEMIRLHAPAQWFGRTLTCDMSIAGTPMRTGQRLFLLVASANRDESEFEEPDAFHAARKMRRVVAFGVGPHFCSGIFLARLEARIMVEEFLKRVRDYEIDLALAERSASEFQIGWVKLPMTVAKEG
jgi:cytochrome P450